MKLLLALGLLSYVAVFCHAAPHCHLSELMSCVDISINWLHSLPKRSIPETDEDVNVMCTEIAKSLECGAGYRDNCTTPLQKELIGLIIEGAVYLERDFCTAGSSSRGKYLAHSICLNKVSQMDTIKEQIEYILAVLEKAQTVETSQFITYACCGYSKVMNSFIKIGQDNCGKEAVDAATEILSLAIAQLPEVLCNGFDSTEDRCQALLPPDGAKPSDQVKGMEIYKFIHNTLKNWLD